MSYGSGKRKCNFYDKEVIFDEYLDSIKNEPKANNRCEVRGFFSYYEALGVSPSSEANDIKRAYRNKILKEHPDKGGDSQKFLKIVKAFNVLHNDSTRKIYDEYGAQAVENYESINLFKNL